MKLWDKGISTNVLIEEFTVGRDREFDMVLAKHDVRGSIAHVTMLSEVGVLTKEESTALIGELLNIELEIVNGTFIIAPDMEDVHSQVEFILTERLGDVGKKIHTGRSRNDQVLVDMKLFMREQLYELRSSVSILFTTLIDLAEQHQHHLLPGYTHFQIAMPNSFGLWFSAYAESLTDDMESVVAAHNVVNKNPLGSAAGYGSSFPLNRTRTTQLLGFGAMNVSSVYAQMTRGKSERVVATALASVAATLSKLAYDICLYTSQNLAFVRLPAEFTTGSSIMPHKQNPDIFELIRAKCNRLQALPNDIILITNNLPSGYHRDFQILKELVFPAFTELQQCLRLATLVLPQLHITPNIMSNELYAYCFSVDAVNKLVQQGASFRDAYKRVGQQIQRGEFAVPEQLTHTHEGSIGNLCIELIQQQMQVVLAKM